MKTCDKQYLIVDYFFHELDETQKKEFQTHLSDCAICRSTSEAFSTTAPLIKKQKRIPPGPELLRHYTQQLKAQYYSVNTFFARITKIFDFLILKPSLSIRFAEAAVLILIGIFIGRMTFWKAQPTQQGVNGKDFSTPHVSALILDNYLQETEMILLDVTNTNPKENDEALMSLSQLAQYRNLLQKTNICRAEAEEAHNEKLIQLTNDIELILLDLCNVEKLTLHEKMNEIKEQINDANLLFKLKNFTAEKI